MRALRRIIPLLLATLAIVAGARDADPLASRVVVLANRDDPGSLRIAQHYAEVRQVPLENLVIQSMPLEETITWTEFVSKVWQPLQDELVRRKWIDAIPMALVDEVGRRKSAIAGHRIAYLVVCRGVPLRIAHDPALYRPHPPLTDKTFFQTNESAVDSELSLLAITDSPINAFLYNPLFRKDHPTALELNQVVKVSRLDGPSVDDACALVDHAIAAERTGLIGRAYVDEGGIHPDGDIWLKDVASQLHELGFDTEVEESRATFPAEARFDAPALYFGWYAPDLNGPFALPGFRFPDGAVAVHIHSASAESLRSLTRGWTGPLVARGVTATVGNVFEPYLQLLHRPDLLLRALARGDRFGDAAYYAEPVLSWQSIAIGDPLYRPFAVPFAHQWKDRGKLPTKSAPYVTLRHFHLIEAAKHPNEAQVMARAVQADHPSLAVGLLLARQSEVAGDKFEVAKLLAFATTIEHFSPDEWGLAHETAMTLGRAAAPAKAAQIFRRLLRDPALPLVLREAWLRDAHGAAAAAGEIDQASAWAAEREGLSDGTKK